MIMITKEQLADLLREGYLKGFEASSEGWNHEYGCMEPEANKWFLQKREEDLQPLVHRYSGGQKDSVHLQPIVIDESGVYRFRENKVVSSLFIEGNFNLNLIVAGDFSDEDLAQFAQLLGYSVSGYGDLQYASRESVEKADAIVSAMSVKREDQQ